MFRCENDFRRCFTQELRSSPCHIELTNLHLQAHAKSEQDMAFADEGAVEG